MVPAAEELDLFVELEEVVVGISSYSSSSGEAELEQASIANRNAAAAVNFQILFIFIKAPF
jgi:hypothetical protein